MATRPVVAVGKRIKGSGRGASRWDSSNAFVNPGKPIPKKPF